MIPDPNKHRGSLDAQRTQAQRKEKKKTSEQEMTSASCFICSYIASYSFPFLFFSSLKKTAGWHVVHLSLKAPGQKCMDEQVVDLSVWL